MVLFREKSPHMTNYKIVALDSISRTDFLASRFVKFKPFWVNRIRKNCHLAFLYRTLPPAIDCGGFATSKPMRSEKFAGKER